MSHAIRNILKSIVTVLDYTLKIVGGLAAVLVVAAVILPGSIWGRVETAAASIYGVKGWVYYEVGRNREPTPNGGLHLLKKSEEGFYKDIRTGDKLRAAKAVYLRWDKWAEGPETYLMEPGACVIVIRKPQNAVMVPDGVISAGWLEVATTYCPIFK